MHIHLGRVENLAHHSSPVVIGDFELMKQWPGDIDGEAEGVMELSERAIFGFTAMELGAPTVFIDGDVVTLLVKEGMTPPKPELPGVDLLNALCSGELDDVEEQGVLEVPSGALVITLAYNATPEEGAPTEHLEETFHEMCPVLPKLVPIAPVYIKELAIVPVTPGTYEVIWGSLGEYERCQLRRVSSGG